MKRLVSTVALVGLLGCVAPGGEYDLSHVEMPIVDGTIETGRPSVVFLYNIRGSACTGTIIAPRVVLTAKHCIDAGGGRAAPASNFRVFVGSNSSRFERQYNVAEVRPAPGRWDLRDGSDVAVLILATPASEEPLEVSFDNPSSLVGGEFTAVGYGQTPSGGSGTKLTTTKRVDGVMGGFIYVRPSVCSGDSGGPLLGPDGRIYGVASFIYSERGGQPRCGSAPGAYNSLTRYRSLIEGAIEDSGSCVPRDEVCNGIDDNCDEVVDEGCTPIGEPCARDDECVGETCRLVGDRNVCTQACDPLRPAIGCPIGMYCAASGCEGFCAFGGPGELSIDAECSDDTECITAYCADPGDGVRRCLPPCQGDAGTCLAGEVCAAAAGACGGCVPRGLVVGARGIGEPCDTDEECGSAYCFMDEGVRYCSRTCTEATEAEDCGDGFHCREVDGAGSCVRGPREDVGGGCVTNADCGSGICATRADGERWCTAFCDTPMDCPDGFLCEDVGGGTICVPEGSLVGSPCETSEECASGLCAIGTPAGNLCSRFCGPDTACSPGFECVRIDGGRSNVCLPAEEEAPPSGGGGCAAGGGGSAPAVMLVLLALAWRRRR